MAADGVTPFRIAAQLSREQIPTPNNYFADLGMKCNRPKWPEWSKTTILQILHNRAYLGHMASLKQTTKSFKNKKTVHLPKEQWVEIPNTHEPLVEQYVFDLAQKIAQVKRREGKPLMENTFSGLLKCSTCGGGMGLACRANDMYGQYNCNLYRRGTKEKHCVSHYISHKALYSLVREDIKRNAAIARQHESELTEYAQKVSGSNSGDKYRRIQKDLDKAHRRSGELDMIIKKLFEQNALGIISDERFISMSADYENEQKSLSAKVAELQGQLDKRNAEGSNTVRFLNAVRKYSDITELNAAILNDLIDSIVVYEPTVKWAKASRVQRVEINYRFIGISQFGESECLSASSA